MILKPSLLLWTSTFLLSARLTLGGEPTKLAIIGGSDNAATAVDVLTAQLSAKPGVQLLERTQINQIYHEQSLTAGSKDYVKMGQILNADGLIFVNLTPGKVPAMGAAFGAAKPMADLRIRLISVKAGVVLQAGDFSLQTEQLADWAASYASQIGKYLSKLSLGAGGAVPISVVRFRYATPTAEAKAAEPALTTLAMERLNQESRFIVLERAAMAKLAEEKDLKLDESAFLNGSYLIEGVMDKNGFNRDTITIDATLTPPKGGAPVAIEASGNRSDLAEVINHLVDKIDDAIRVGSRAPAWNPEEEAAQFYKEGQWGLRWGNYPEAIAAAEAAWSLGKKDPDGAALRVAANAREASKVKDLYETEEGIYGPTYDGDGRIVVKRAEPAVLLRKIAGELGDHEGGGSYTVKDLGDTWVVNYAYAKGPDDPHCIECASTALDYYRQFSQNQPNAGQSNVVWNHLGIDSLETAGQVLRYYYLFPNRAKAAEDAVAGLRALARSVADMMSQSPPVHDSYFVGDRVTSRDEIFKTMDNKPNLFRCETQWSCYWQEKPEDAVALYRQLMSSPVFSYIHKGLWFRQDGGPRLVGWTDSDRAHAPAAWNDYMRELQASPDILHQLEAKVFAFIDAQDDAKKGAAFTNFFDSLVANREALLSNNVDVLYLDWGTADLVNQSGIATALSDCLRRSYYGTYRPKLEEVANAFSSRHRNQGQDAAHAEWKKHFPDKDFPGEVSDATIEKQVQFLKDKKPFNHAEFFKLFAAKRYTKAQALKLKPLMDDYVTNLTAHYAQYSESDQRGHRGDVQTVTVILGNELDFAIHPPARVAATHAAPNTSAGPPNQPGVEYGTRRRGAQAVPLEPTTNIVDVTRYLPIPAAPLIPKGMGSELGACAIAAHQWVENKLVLDLTCATWVYSANSAANLNYPAIAVLDPDAGTWRIAPAKAQGIMEVNNLYHRSTLFNGEIYTCDGGQIEKFDSQSGAWTDLSVSDGNKYELYNVHHHLYAANDVSVFEIIDGGASSRLLVSRRRQPPVSSLDSVEFGFPAMFPGAGGTLRLFAAGHIFTWMGSDWRKDEEIPASGERGSPAEFARGIVFGGKSVDILPDGVLFARTTVSRLATDSNQAEICLRQEYARPANPPPAGFGPPMRKQSAPVMPATTWDVPAQVTFSRAAFTSHGADLFALQNHSELQDVVDEKQHLKVGIKVISKDGYHADLFCFVPGQRAPLRVGLKFDDSQGRPPLGEEETWMFAAPEGLMFGQERIAFGLNAGPSVVKNGYVDGVWLLPYSRLDAAVAAARQSQPTPMKAASSSGVSTVPAGP